MLVLGMIDANGTVRADALYPVAEACHLSGDQVRSCLRRLVAEGLFDREGSGRRARFHASPAGLALLGAQRERIRRAYAQDGAERVWDGRWRLAAFAVPEAQRPARDAFRDRLRALGGAALQGGLYVSPRPWDEEVRSAARRIGVAPFVSLATTRDLEVGGVGEPRLLACRLWPLAELERRYAAFVDAYRSLPGRLVEMRAQHDRLSDAQLLPGALAMAADFSRCFEADPLLPRELLPPDWAGRTARELLLRSRRLALAIRGAQGRPSLFRLFDDTLEAPAADTLEDRT